MPFLRSIPLLETALNVLAIALSLAINSTSWSIAPPYGAPSCKVTATTLHMHTPRRKNPASICFVDSRQLHGSMLYGLLNPHRKPARKVPMQNSAHMDDGAQLNGARREAAPGPISRSIADDGGELISILHKNGFGQNIVTLYDSDISRQPAFAEIYASGQWKLCAIVGLKPPSSNNENMPPRFEVVILVDDENSMEHSVIDVGQVTTIWPTKVGLITPNGGCSSSLQDAMKFLASTAAEAKVSILQDFPVNHGERSLQRLYNSYVGRARKKSSLTKKQITKLSSKAQNGSRVDEVLRKIVKAGKGMSRLVDSATAAEFLYDDYAHDKGEGVKRRIVGAEMLCVDAKLGGRFKRMSCTFVSSSYETQADCDRKNIHSVSVVNGGWMVVDCSVRAGAEARKFAERSATTFNVPCDSSEARENNAVPSSLSLPVQLVTAADQRIAHRLECLAMGDILSEEQTGSEGQQVELDVREALKTLGLPVTPSGARQALLKFGRWSENAEMRGKNGKEKKMLVPWSPQTLDAARMLEVYEKDRRRFLYQHSSAATKKHDAVPGGNERNDLEGRVDLSTLPCVCIDAKRVTFRDDAIGVRPRSSTGRKVIKAASKWEILIHIADVSDIYSPEPQFVLAKGGFDATCLRRAAESRGFSRYDLPLGPLHLMPPVALSALSLVTDDALVQTNAQKDGVAIKKRGHEALNRCVTLWTYIDERTGKLIDSGLERTVISKPIALSFLSATALLEGEHTGEGKQDQFNPTAAKARAILSVAERNLSLWSKQHRSTNEAARKREERLRVKELVSREAMGEHAMRDDGRGRSFMRTKGHRVVDSALDLYAFSVSRLLRRAKQPVPRASGSGAERGGRLGTAPLRRYIDGIAQRQALAVLCDYGGSPLTRDECFEANKIAAEASNAIANLRSVKASRDSTYGNDGARGQQLRQRDALRGLAGYIARTGSGKRQVSVQAVCTGRENEVLILGNGAVAKCGGVKGTLRTGEKVLVRVVKLDPEKGLLSVNLSQP